MNEQTPKQIVEALDKYIVGQKEAKRAVAIALRNRWRSRQLDNISMQDDIVPKNILMIGSTGVGKTEIARRLAKLVDAPFIKVEATKFTEVGYVGRDVESIIRDLAETAVRMVRQTRIKSVQEKALEMAQERILDVLVPEPKKSANPFGQLFGNLANNEEQEESQTEEPKQYTAGREWCRKKLEAGEYEDKVIEIDVEDTSKPMVGMFAGSSLEGMGDNLQDMIGNMMPKRHKKRKVTVEQARKLFQQEEAMKLVDMEEIQETAVKLAENTGIVFLDEILNSRDGLIDLFNRAMKGWSKALDREDQWAEKTGFFSDASNLQRQSNNAVNEYNRIMTAAEENCDEFQFWNTESRKEDLDLIRQAYEYYDLDDDDNNQDSLKEDYDNIVASKETISIYKSFLQKKKQSLEAFA